MGPRVAVLVLVLILVATGSARAQTSPPSDAETPLSFKVLVDQIRALYPVIQTDVVEVTGDRVILAAGRADGVAPGIELSTFRAGEELYHPTKKTLLGRKEEPLGRIVIRQVFENYSVATQVDGKRPDPGDQARVSAGKIVLAVVPLSSGPSARVVDAATQEFVKELDATKRFQVVIGDHVAAYLAQEKIPAGEFMAGRGVRQAQQYAKAGNVLALHFTTMQGKPWVDVRLFSATLGEALLQTALSVPTSLSRRPTRDYSSGGAAGEVKVEKRSLLAKLISGDFEPHQYSASAGSIPIRQLATFPFIVTSLDIVTQPNDRIPRLAVTDGKRVFQYRLDNQTLTAEWTYSRSMVGNILSVQLADLNGDGVLDVVVNRQDAKTGMLSYILTTRKDKPVLLAEDIPFILLAVDETGEGPRRALWGQAYNEEKFYGKGGAKRYTLSEKARDIVAAGPATVNQQFRALGVTFSNIAGKDQRVMAFVDERSRLVIAQGAVEMWKSLTPVGGGGLAKAHLRENVFNTQVDKFYTIEPHPVAVDLDGDGVDEIVVPVNQDDAGRMAVVFKVPAGFRMRVVNSGFEGTVTGLGAIANDGGYPALLATVVKRSGLFQDSGETQLIMTGAE